MTKINPSSIRIKLSLQQVDAVYYALQQAITQPPADRVDSLLLIQLHELYLKVRVRFEYRQKNLSMKPSQAYAFWIYFGIKVGVTSYERNTINMINTQLDAILK